MTHHAPFSVRDIESAVLQGREAEQARIVALLEHQEVWNSLDHKWVHPTYCLTCRNIERIQGGTDALAPTWSEEVQDMKKEWPE